MLPYLEMDLNQWLSILARQTLLKIPIKFQLYIKLDYMCLLPGDRPSSSSCWNWLTFQYLLAIIREN